MILYFRHKVAPSVGTAVIGDVRASKTFSNSSTTGLTGTLTDNGTPVITPSTANQNLNGIYNSGAYVKGDTNLITGNIKAGISIFGVAGKTSVVDTADGSTNTAALLTGYSMYANGVKQAGTMNNFGAVNYTPTPSGYSLGTGYISSLTVNGDANLVAGNIKAGVSIFGVAGSVHPNNTVYPGSVVLFSNANGTTTIQTTAQKLRDVKINNLGGTIRTSFDLATSSNGYAVYGQIYKNGVAVGTQRVVSSGDSVYVTFTEDIAFSAGDDIQLYSWTPSGTTSYVRNFQLSVDNLVTTTSVL